MEPSGTVVEPSAEPSVFPMFSYTFSTPPVFTLCTYYIIINSRGNRNRRPSGGPGPSRILIGGLGASIGRVLCGHLWAFALMWPRRCPRRCPGGTLPNLVTPLETRAPSTMLEPLPKASLRRRCSPCFLEVFSEVSPFNFNIIKG